MQIMREEQIPENKIQEYVDNFENAINRNDKKEAIQVIADMNTEVATKINETRPSGQQTLQRREEDAVQEQSPEGVDVQEQTRDSQEVRRRDTQEQETTLSLIHI